MTGLSGRAGKVTTWSMRNVGSEFRDLDPKKAKIIYTFSKLNLKCYCSYQAFPGTRLLHCCGDLLVGHLATSVFLFASY